MSDCRLKDQHGNVNASILQHQVLESNKELNCFLVINILELKILTKELEIPSKTNSVQGATNQISLKTKKASELCLCGF